MLIVFETLNPDNHQKKALLDEKLPRIGLIVPCYNEADFVKQKVEDLKKLNYDKDLLNIYFFNGLSTDDTSAQISESISDFPNWHLIETQCKGKIAQINFGLEKMNDDIEIVVSTDMDTLLAADVLLEFAKEFKSNKEIAVVGANVSPKNCIAIERNFWQNQNLMRVLESNVYSSSIVVAPCYAYRRHVIKQFPEDCIADDVYVAFKANTEGYLVKYSKHIIAYELRAPNSGSEFFRHKFRKSNAFLFELFRFFYRLPQMSPWWKAIYLTKLLQLAIIPWALPYFILSTISIALSGGALFQMAFFGSLFLLISLYVTSTLLARCRIKNLDIKDSKKRHDLKPFIVSNIILILVGLSYPFYRQTSNYQRIDYNETGL